MKDFTTLQLDHVIFSQQTENHGVLSSNRSKVAKYSSSNFLTQKRMPITHFGLQKRHLNIHLLVQSLHQLHQQSRPTFARTRTLVKLLKTTTLQLEHFDAEKNKWVPTCLINLQIEVGT